MWFFRDVVSEVKTNVTGIYGFFINKLKRETCKRNGPIPEIHYETTEREITEMSTKCTRCNQPIAYSQEIVNKNDADAVYEQIKAIQKTPCVL